VRLNHAVRAVTRRLVSLTAFGDFQTSSEFNHVSGEFNHAVCEFNASGELNVRLVSLIACW
jgi:hypothetical protein